MTSFIKYTNAILRIRKGAAFFCAKLTHGRLSLSYMLFCSRPSRKRLGLSPPFGISPLRASPLLRSWIPHEGLRPCKKIYTALLMQAWQSSVNFLTAVNWYQKGVLVSETLLCYNGMTIYEGTDPAAAGYEV